MNTDTLLCSWCGRAKPMNQFRLQRRQGRMQYVAYCVACERAHDRRRKLARKAQRAV